MTNKITDIFFDLDHTIWDFEANSKLAFEKLLNKNKIEISIDDFLKIYEPINKNYWDRYAQAIITKKEVKYGRLIDTFSTLNIAVDDDFINKFASDYLNLLKEETILMDGTIEILEYLFPKYRLHILTNGFIEIQNQKIINSKLDKYFIEVISSEEIGKQKPHPEVFNYALKKANTSSYKSIMIGDNFKSDILGARNVGMQAIFYDIAQQNLVEDKIIPSIKHLSELRNLL